MLGFFALANLVAQAKKEKLRSKHRFSATIFHYFSNLSLTATRKFYDVFMIKLKLPALTFERPNI